MENYNSEDAKRAAKKEEINAKIEKLEKRINRYEQEERKIDNAILISQRRRRAHRLIQLGAIISNMFEFDPLSVDPEDFNEFTKKIFYVATPFPEKIENGKYIFSWHEVKKVWEEYLEDKNKGV